MKLEAVVEGLLFVVGEEGLTLNQLVDILEVDLDQVKEILNKLRERYEKEDSGIRIHFLGDRFKLTTKPEHKKYFQKLIENPENNTFSQAALETLAIIAYNEPITRLEVDEIRGVSSSQMIRKLVAKGLIKEVGRSDAVGRPILYRTTSEFLDYFGLSSKEDLPKLEDFAHIDISRNEDIDLYHSKYTEIDEEEKIEELEEL